MKVKPTCSFQNGFCGIAAALLSICCLAATPASARIYVDFIFGFPSDDPATLFDEDAGSSDFDFDLDTNFALSAAVGLESGIFRSELEITFRETEGLLLDTDPPSASTGSGSFDSISLMSNLYLDIPIGFGFEIFGGGGVGLVVFDAEADGTGDLDTADFDDSGYGFAWQLRGGLAYELTPNVTLSAGYRYWRSSEIDFGSFELEETEIHAVDLGLRLTF